MNTEKFIADRNNGIIRMDTIWERYFDKKHSKHTQVVERFNWMISQTTGPRLLDIGCSNGLGIFLAAKREEIHELVGVDVCRKAVVEAIKHNFDSGKSIRINYGLAEKLEFRDQYFNCILMGEVLEHVMSDSTVLREAYRVLKIGGVGIISVPNEGKISKDHLRVYSKKSIEDLLKKVGFTIKDSLFQSEWILLKVKK